MFLLYNHTFVSRNTKLNGFIAKIIILKIINNKWFKEQFPNLIIKLQAVNLIIGFNNNHLLNYKMMD